MNIISKTFTPVNILSSLDSSTSILPLVVKDAANTAGRTIMAEQAGGEHESRERFIEEAGTAALWLGGIPLSRKIFDKTVFKAYGLNPEISINKIFKKGPQQLTEAELKKLSPNSSPSLVGKELVKKYKHLHISKFLVSTLVPFALLTVVLPKLNQNLSKKIIMERAAKENEKTKPNNANTNNVVPQEQQKSLDFTGKEVSHRSVHLKTLEQRFNKNTSNQINFAFKTQPNNNPTFAGIGSLTGKACNGLLNAAAGAEVSAVDNMLLLDLGISGNRVTFVPRNNQERAEYAIKEGGILFFFFFAQRIMKKGFDALSNKLKVPVDLDFKTLSSDSFKNKMKEIHNNPSKENIEHLTQFTDLTGSKNTEENAFEFIKNNHKNNKFLTLQTAKELGVIKTDTKGELNPAKYIEVKDVEKISKDIKNFTTAMQNSKLKPEQFIKKAKNLKTGFLVANFAICTAALGYVLPKIQYIFREKVYGSKEFPGIKGYKEEASHISGKK